MISRALRKEREERYQSAKELLADLLRLRRELRADAESRRLGKRHTENTVEALINNLEAGLTLDEFLDNFPTVTREQALRVLGFVKNTLLKPR